MTTNELKAMAKNLGFHTFEELYNDASEMTMIYSKEEKEHKQAMEAIEQTIKTFQYVMKDTVIEDNMKAIIEQLKEQMAIIDKELENIESAWGEQTEIIMALEEMDEYTYYSESF